MTEGCPEPPICCDPDPEDRVLSWVAWVALVLGICPWRVCSFQPPPSRLARDYPRSLASSALYVQLKKSCCKHWGVSVAISQKAVFHLTRERAHSFPPVGNEWDMERPATAAFLGNRGQNCGYHDSSRR